MRYDSYVQKINKVAKAKKIVLKNKIIIIIIASAIALLTSFFLIGKGKVVDLEYQPSIEYGDNFYCDSKVLFSNQIYEFSKEGSDVWTTTVPTTPGKYNFRVVTKGSFNSTSYSKEYEFIITPKKLMVSPSKTEITFGDQLEFTADFPNNEKIITADYLFEDLTKKESYVSVIPESVIIHNEKGEDVTSYYEVIPVKTKIHFDSHLLLIDIKGAEKIYDGTPLSSTEWEIISGSLLENHQIKIEFKASQTNVGEIPNEAISVKIYNGDEDYTINYNIIFNVGSLKVNKRPITIKTSSLEKTYDGLFLSSEDAEIISGSLIDGHKLKLEEKTSIVNVASSGSNILRYIIVDGNNQDVTANYDITYEYGMLTIKPYELTVTTGNIEKIYDGIESSNNSYEIVGNSLLEGHTISIDTLTKVKNAGEYDNEITFKIFSGRDDVTSNYKINGLYGKIKISPRPITIVLKDKEKTYDSLPLISNEHEEIGNLLENHAVEITTKTNQKNVGIGTNTIDTCIIKDTVSSEIVTDNYLITKIDSILTVHPRPLTVFLKQESRVYDGTYFTSNDTVNLNLLDNHYIEVETDGKMLNVGETINHITSYIIKDKDTDEVVTDNYLVTTTNGLLTVTPRPISIKLSNEEKEFDNAFLTSTNYQEVENLLDKHVISLSTTGSQLSIGSSNNSITSYEIKDSETDEIVTGNYEVTTVDGKLTVTKRSITISSESKEKVYDSLPLFANNWEVIEGSILEGFDINLTIDCPNSIVNAGEIYNEYTYVITNLDKVLEIYDISFVTGTLKITPRKITIKVEDIEKIYDGKVLKSTSYEKIENLLDNHQVSINTDGQILNVGTCDNKISTYTITDRYNHQDVKMNYEVTVEQGTLSIKKRPIVIELINKEKIYDGLTLESSEIREVSNLLSEHIITCFVRGRQTNAGTSSNIIESYQIINLFTGETVNENYDVTLINGTLTVTKRPIKITLIDKEKVYDDTALTSSEFEVDSLILGDTLLLTTSGSQINAGKSENTVQTCEIINSSNTVVTNNYDITLISGTLTVTKRPLIIRAISDSKVYDDTPLVCKGFITHNKVSSHVSHVTIGGSQTNVGTSEATIEVYEIMNANYEIVTDNYDVTIQNGTLTVTPKSISVNVINNTKIYNGEAFISNNVQVIDRDFISYHRVIAETSGRPVEVGTTNNSVSSYTIININTNEDVTYNYKVTFNDGTLTINPRPISIKMVPKTKVYDGEALQSNEYYTIENLLPNHLAEVIGSGSQIDVGSIRNDVASCKIIDIDTREDVTMNYEIATKYEWLTVTPRPITITVVNKEKIYDGTKLVSNEITVENLVEGHYVDEVETSGSQLDVGTSGNTILKYTIYDNDYTKIVTSNYSVNRVHGSLTVNPRPITIKLTDVEKVYDGIELTSELYDEIENLLPDNKVTVSTFGRITDVGTESNVINPLYTRISDKNNNDITSNYDITFLEGKLTITKRPITITLVDKEKIYDGTVLRSLEVTADNLASLEEVYVNAEGSQLDVGTIENIITFVAIKNIKSSRLTTTNYNITLVNGMLTVHPRPITISTESVEKIYDDTPLIATTWKVSGDLLEIHELNVIVNGSMINAGSSLAEIDKYAITDIATGEDVTKNYDVTIVEGTLTIHPRPIEIIIGSKEKIYDGMPLTNYDNEYFLETIPLPQHKVELWSKGSQTDAGTSYTEISNIIISNIYDGTDVTSNYEIRETKGTLTVHPRELSISISGGIKTYDGLPYTSNSFIVHHSSETLLSHHKVEITTVGSITNVGKCSNELESWLVKDIDTGRDVTKNYVLKEVISGELIVNPRYLQLFLVNKEKVYDGTYLTSTELESYTNVASTDEVLVTTSGSQLNAGSSINKITAYTVINKETLENVTSNYTVSIIDGNLTVTKRPVTIRLTEEEKEFDGTYLYPSIVLADNLVSSHRIMCEKTGGQLEVGTSITTIDSCQIFSDSYDVTDNYEITLESGTVTVIPRKITIASKSATKEYDGTPLTNNNWGITTGSIVEGYEIDITINCTGTITEVGTTMNTFDYHIKNLEKVNKYYDIEFAEGTLSVSKKTITITTGSSSKEYDGLPLTNSTWVLTSGTLAEGDELNVSCTGYIDSIGLVLNECQYSIKNGSINNEENYNIIINLGTLTITKIPLSIQTGSDSKLYDGTPLTNRYFESSDENLLPDHILDVEAIGTITEVGTVPNDCRYTITKDGKDVSQYYEVVITLGELTINALQDCFKVTSDYDGIIYLRGQTYGNYQGTISWLNAPIYNNPAFNALALSTKAIENKGYKSYFISVEKIINDNIYYIPYYVSNFPTGEVNDAIINTGESNYTTSFTPYSYLLSGALNNNNTNYSSFEEEYRDFVYDNYLTVPFDTRKAMLEIAARENLSSDDISKIVNYIRNAATYDLNYKFPDNIGDIATYFLNISKKGVCSHFATAATVMFRSLGIPARYVTGFVAQVKEGQTTTVQNDKAHAWVEIYIDNMGWVQLEVTGMYEDKEEEIEKRTITITPINKEKVYDSTPLTISNTEFEVTGDLPEGYEVRVQISGSITNYNLAGSRSEITSYLIFDNEGNNVTDDFNVYLRTGILRILQRELYFETGSATKDYDSTPLTCPVYRLLSGEIVDGQVMNAYTTGSIIEGAPVNNTINVEIFDGQTDVTMNYKIICDYGILTINDIRENIEFCLYPIESIYDGTALICTSEDYYISTDNLPSNYRVELEVFGVDENNTLIFPSITNVGTLTTTIKNIVIYNELGEKVNYLYNICVVDGLLRVNPNELMVTVESKIKSYDGKPLIPTYCWITSANLPVNYQFIAVLDGSQTKVGISQSTISSWIVLNQDGEDVSNNFLLRVTMGILQVIEQEVD